MARLNCLVADSDFEGLSSVLTAGELNCLLSISPGGKGRGGRGHVSGTLTVEGRGQPGGECVLLVSQCGHPLLCVYKSQFQMYPVLGQGSFGMCVRIMHDIVFHVFFFIHVIGLCVHTCVHVHIGLCVRTYTYRLVSAYMCTYRLVHAYVCTYRLVCEYMCTYRLVRA